jgi:subtilisin family serine protease
MSSWVATTACFCILFATSLTTYAYEAPEPIDPHLQGIGADPLVKTSWHLDHIKVFDAWKVTKGDQRVTVAIIDSGIKYNHPEFVNRVKRKASEAGVDGRDNDNNGFIDDLIGWNFNDEQRLPHDDNGHGTFVASIIAAEGNNGVGGSGICPRCSILPLRFLDMDGFGDTEDAIRSINYAVSEKASVINLSFAGEGYDRALHNALKGALAQDIVVVAACGNDGMNIDKEDIYPAKFKLPNLLSVAATKKNEDTTARSNYGTKYVHIGAPGVNIWGLWEDDKWYRSSGTSFATPMVVGVAALIRSAYPNLSAPEVVEIIKATARKVKPLLAKVSTGGVLDASAAMSCAGVRSLPCLDEEARSRIQEAEELAKELRLKLRNN